MMESFILDKLTSHVAYTNGDKKETSQINITIDLIHKILTIFLFILICRISTKYNFNYIFFLVKREF